MTTLLLVRHGQAETTGRLLSGWTPGVHLAEEGRRQAEGLVERLRGVSIDAMYASPLERCRETAAPLERDRGLKATVRKDVGEIGFGDWTGQPLARLAKNRLWSRVQFLPSRMRFPNGESFAEAQARAVAALEAIVAEHPRGTVAVFSHADLIRLVLAHYLGTHLDLFQRIHVDTASVSAVRLGDGMPMILTVNHTGDLHALRARPRPRRKASTRRPKGARR
ncbi:MAG: MSMEG_4193 family putative phosphomutase [Actinomycetota bacterium]